jgi:3-hydroxyisobutyrate dehydrogenase-like beta-hydroxyacid dehydrogenase
MLPNHTIVKKVCEGDQGIFKLAKKGSIIIDSSTISPKAAIELHESAKKADQ